MNQKRIETLQILRLFGAICIILYHASTLGPHGYFAVEIFSILSGYILMYSTQSIRSKKGFLRKRLLRIIPLYWGSTFLMYALLLVMPQLSLMSEPTLESLVTSLFFIPFTSSKGFTVPLVSIGWTLNYEILFYGIFFIALHISHKYRGVITGIALIIFVGLGALFDINSTIWDFYTDSFILEFGFGILAFYFINWISQHELSTLMKRILVAVCCVCLVFMWLDIGVETPIARCVRLGIPALILFIGVVVVYREKTYPPILVEFGNATFSIYLLEFFSTAVYKVLVPYIPSVLVPVLLVIMTIATVIAGYILYKYVEIPSFQKLKGILIRD